MCEPADDKEQRKDTIARRKVWAGLCWLIGAAALTTWLLAGALFARYPLTYPWEDMHPYGSLQFPGQVSMVAIVAILKVIDCVLTSLPRLRGRLVRLALVELVSAGVMFLILLFLYWAVWSPIAAGR
jgi:hypothetical protein